MSTPTDTDSWERHDKMRAATLPVITIENSNRKTFGCPETVEAQTLPGRMNLFNNVNIVGFS